MNLHVLPRNCVEIERMIRFRDHLRSSDDDRQLYERTKRDLAVREWKYVHRHPDGPHELFALAHDPGERHNRVDDPA